MDKSESIKELAAALNKAQNEMGGAVKDAKNPFFKSNYADLGAVVKAIKEPFATNGLSYSQFPITDGDRVGIETILMHSSGEWISQPFTVKLTKQDAQGAGSAITYCRRYALQAIAGIPSEDDDGQAASKQASKPKGFTMDATAQSWVIAAKADIKALDQITDVNYRNFIKGEL
tara:strand:- start:215 stop:736 length:522 start_codon:yes stop_codon:yes gene_type:complete